MYTCHYLSFDVARNANGDKCAANIIQFLGVYFFSVSLYNALRSFDMLWQFNVITVFYDYFQNDSGD